MGPPRHRSTAYIMYRCSPLLSHVIGRIVYRCSPLNHVIHRIHSVPVLATQPRHPPHTVCTGARHSATSSTAYSVYRCSPLSHVIHRIQSVPVLATQPRHVIHRIQCVPVLATQPRHVIHRIQCVPVLATQPRHVIHRIVTRKKILFELRSLVCHRPSI